jgi:hypothetical protein
MIDRRMGLAREWDELVEEVRKLDGFADFLKPPRLATLLPAAAEGPIAIINVSRWRCDALLVQITGVEVVELRGLTAESVADKTNDYLGALQNVDQATHALYMARLRVDDGDHGLEITRQYTMAKRALFTAERERDTVLEVVMRWLWDEIADPVLTALGFVGTPAPEQPWPRLWWCPTGALTLLPLHAAGYHRVGAPGRSVLDRVVSSYTPTLRALVEARKPLRAAPDDEQMLIVALPDTPGEVPLADVARERDLLRSLFAGRHTLLEGAGATPAAVRALLPGHRWAHFSCHGTQNLADPSAGGLVLQDGILAIADISAQQHEGEFAFLSACMTAVGGVNLPDEAITLAAALHFTGYRQVIGTLWSVYDETAADVAAMVYAELHSTGRFEPARSAHALHGAIRRLRDVDGAPPHRWTPFTHTGV